MVGVTERCEIQAGSGEEAVGKAGRYGIGLSRDFASAVSRLRGRLGAAAFRGGGLGGEAGARAWTADAGGAAGVGHGGEGRAPGAGVTTWSWRCWRWASSVLTTTSWPGRRRAAPAAPTVSRAPVASAIPAVRARRPGRRGWAGARSAGRAEGPWAGR